MAKESFTTIDQVARDMRTGEFPAMSDQTKHEMAERERVFGVALKSIEVGAPGVADAVRRGIARSIAMKLAPTGPEPAPAKDQIMTLHDSTMQMLRDA